MSSSKHSRGFSGQDTPSPRPASTQRNSVPTGELVEHPLDTRYPDGAHSPTLGRKVAGSRKARRREESALTGLCAWIVDHQIGLSTNFLILLFLSHLCFPAARRHTRKFFELSYYDPKIGKYGKGWNDIFMVVYWVIIFTGLRAAVMEWLLIPFARWGGVTKLKRRMRFAEQAWLFLYYTAFWTLGMYIMYKSKYWLNLRELWTDYPERQMDGLFKWYYLVQYAFWIQQILVVNIEERRKDHHQMVTHHLITCALMFGSYGYHQARVGNAFLCVMDVVDLLLPMAKMLKYFHFNTACDVAFGVFLVTWFGARHVLYMMLLYSVFVHLPETIPFGCYSGPNGKGPDPSMPAPASLWKFLAPFMDSEGPVCWTEGVHGAFKSLLVALQVITCVWFVMIMKVAWRVIKGGAAEDSRSDDEDEVEEEEDFGGEITADLTPLEEDVGVEAINLKGHTRPYRKGAGNATGVTLPGHSDRKELLGRIGCERGV
ncbi:MAG: sphingosine N-acyltransferase lag1 [Geoglossum umbratile]|nr:MAG: sphingosine N-acyltransferase lag1 [Geoglossum umbratile]